MPVFIDEYIKIRDVEGKEQTGKALASNLVAVEDEEKVIHYGLAVGMNHLHTTIVCDNPQCENSTVDDSFKTVPKTIEFDESEDTAGTFLKDVVDVVIVSDFKGQKTVFCSDKCYAKFTKKAPATVLAMPSGKGSKTVLTEE